MPRSLELSHPASSVMVIIFDVLPFRSLLSLIRNYKNLCLSPLCRSGVYPGSMLSAVQKVAFSADHVRNGKRENEVRW